MLSVLRTRDHLTNREGYRKNGVEKAYSAIAKTFDAVSSGEHLETTLHQHDFRGTVLDLGCGAGLIGKLLIQQHSATEVQVTGVDISASMCEWAVKNGYVRVDVGPMQDVIQKYEDGSFDHIVSSGSLHFLDSFAFSTTLEKIFTTATRSITLVVGDFVSNLNPLDMFEYASFFILINTLRLSFLLARRLQRPTCRARSRRDIPLQ